MSTYRFGFDHARFHAFRTAFAPRKPRHPMLRLLFGVMGLVVLLLLVFFSVFVGAAMIAVGLAYKLLSQRGRPIAARDSAVMDGEYHVVRKPVLPLSR